VRANWGRSGWLGDGGRCSRDLGAGQSTIEWLALMAMLVAVAGMLVATVPSIGDTIVGAFEKIVNAVTG
jgi:hypothetical protein